MRSEIAREIDGVRAEIAGLRGEIAQIHERIDGVQRTMMLGFVTLTGGMLAGFAAICTLIATKL